MDKIIGRIYFLCIYLFIDHDVSGGRNQYLVKWKTLPLEDTTWEDDTTLTTKEDKEKIEEYFNTLKKRINQVKHSVYLIL